MQKLKHHLVSFGAGVVTMLLVMPSLSLADLGLTLASFSNGDVADANAVNSNFTQLTDSANGLDSRIGALESKVPASCTEGQVLVWSDSSGAWACGAAADVTSDNATVCTAAGGTWDGSTSTCSPGLNCWAAGFCHQTQQDWGTGLPNARFGAATEQQCTAAGLDHKWDEGSTTARFPPLQQVDSELAPALCE